jgi:hypothetical protein
VVIFCGFEIFLYFCKIIQLIMNASINKKKTCNMETLAINPAQRMIIESFAATRDEEWHT